MLGCSGTRILWPRVEDKGSSQFWDNQALLPQSRTACHRLKAVVDSLDHHIVSGDWCMQLSTIHQLPSIGVQATVYIMSTCVIAKLILWCICFHVNKIWSVEFVPSSRMKRLVVLDFWSDDKKMKEDNGSNAVDNPIETTNGDATEASDIKVESTEWHFQWVLD